MLGNTLTFYLLGGLDEMSRKFCIDIFQVEGQFCNRSLSRLEAPSLLLVSHLNGIQVSNLSKKKKL